MNRKQIAIMVFILALLFSMILLIDESFFDKLIQKFVGGEPFKVLLQFSFITMLGGAIFLYMNVVKDEETNLEMRISTKMNLANEIDELYRATKHIKRTLRSRSITANNTMRIEKDFFEKNMDELDKIQISLEQNREIIKNRVDLFDPIRRGNLVSALHYSARYFHDVFEDFERKKTTLNGNEYTITNQCQNIHDFLLSNLPPQNINNHIFIMKDYKISSERRWAAFKEILEIRKTPDNRKRYRDVAERCFSLAVEELKSR